MSTLLQLKTNKKNKKKNTTDNNTNDDNSQNSRINIGLKVYCAVVRDCKFLRSCYGLFCQGNNEWVTNKANSEL